MPTTELMPRSLAILSTGMITGVGLNRHATCAALRAGITAFEETKFMDDGGKWILGAAIPLDGAPRGAEKLAQMAALAIREAISEYPALDFKNIPLFLGTAERSRPGRFTDLDSELIPRIQKLLGLEFHHESREIPQGRVSGVTGIQLSRSALLDSGFDHCLLVGVDTYLIAATLEHFEARHRLLTSKNTDGFIPGEAAIALLLGRTDSKSSVMIAGIGSGTEPATVESGEPLRADGMVNAFKSALDDAGATWNAVSYRVTDLNGEQYFFREAALALTRTLRPVRAEFDIWHAADCIGEIGAAAVPCALAIGHDAAIKGYAPGSGVLCHFSSDGPERAAVILDTSRTVR